MSKLLSLIVIHTLAIAFPGIGTAETAEKLTRGNEATKKIPRSSAAPSLSFAQGWRKGMLGATTIATPVLVLSVLGPTKTAYKAVSQR
jgi:hypothetical protein